MITQGQNHLIKHFWGCVLTGKAWGSSYAYLYLYLYLFIYHLEAISWTYSHITYECSCFMLECPGVRAPVHPQRVFLCRQTWPACCPSSGRELPCPWHLNCLVDSPCEHHLGTGPLSWLYPRMTSVVSVFRMLATDDSAGPLYMQDLVKALVIITYSTAFCALDVMHKGASPYLVGD